MKENNEHNKRKQQKRRLMERDKINTLTANKDVKKWKLIIYATVILLYVAANIYLMFCHEAWRDESQAWVLAKQLSWTQIPSICASEGHPVLWFYLLKISIILGLPFKYFSVISILFMTISLGIFLFRSCFHPISKVSIVLSPLFFYYNPVICRNYSVLMMIICLLCIVWKDRHEKPIIYSILTALLFQTHVLIFGLAIGFMLEMCISLIVKKKNRDIKHFSGLFIMVSSFALMLLELKQGSGSKNFIDITGDYLISRIRDGEMLFRITGITGYFDYGKIRLGFVVLLATFLVLVVFLFLALDKEFRNHHLYEGLVYLCGTGVYFGIVVFIRDIAHIQMALVLCMIVLYFCWVLRGVKRGFIFEILLLVMCIPLIPKSLVIDTYYDINEQYSGSKEMARIINDNVEDNSMILINSHYLSTSIIAYLSDLPNNYIIWDLENDRQFVIHKWGDTYSFSIDERNVAEYADKIIEETGFAGNVYYVKCNEYSAEIMNGTVNIKGCYNEDTELYVPEIEQNERLTLIDKNRESNYRFEYYILYKIKSGNDDV